jgi:hypothetical protein
MKGLVQSRAVPRRGGATRRAHPGGGPRSWFVWAGAGLLGACAASPGGVSPEPAPPLPVRFSVAPAAPELPSSIATREESAGPETAPPGPFEGRESVTYGEFIEELRRVADELADTPEVRRGYERLLSEYQLTSADVSPQTYSRVRLVFEATRDGGFWGIRWDITDRMPWSDAIWEQWRAHDWTKEEEAATSPLSVETDTTPGRAASRDDAASEAARETTPREVIPRAAAPREVTSPTAVAECDELSALFALLARDLEIDGFVGLFWPTWNHTVAVWQVPRSAGGAGQGPAGDARILVPTSQIWLSRQATLGTREFKTNRVVFPYRRRDLRPEAELPGPLVRALVDRARRYGPLSDEQLLARRNRLGGS